MSVLAELERWGLVLRRRDGGPPHASEAPGHSRPRLPGWGAKPSAAVLARYAPPEAPPPDPADRHLRARGAAPLGAAPP